MQILVEVAQVDDWIGHQLAWPMVGDLSAALCAVQGKRRIVGAESQVLQGAARAQGIYWAVLHQDQKSGGCANVL